MSTYYDVFISYSRGNSKVLAILLNQRLKQENLHVWFDQNDIPPAVDWQEQIKNGIERSHNFLFLISPGSVKSEYCRQEIELAVEHNKRILPLHHVDSNAELDLMHPIIKERNWLPEWLETSENFDFELSLQKLLLTLKEDEDYIKQHTKYLVAALEWERNQKQTEYLLVGEDRVKAEDWLKVKFENKQAPCLPTDLLCAYICTSIKNANNFQTQVFICHNELDNEERDKLVKALNRQGITSWTNKTDIEAGKDYQTEINKGIEGADNFVYLLSPNSVNCSYCQQELDHALKYNKRIIPILLQSVTIPGEIQSIQFIDWTVTPRLDELIRVIKEDANYYNKHKILLVKSLKWWKQKTNPSLLLRGYNLEHFEAWLKTVKASKFNQPLPLQLEFIRASKEQNQETTLDVFISYSRKDSDFAYKLNEQLQELGKTTWFDQESIAVGEDFEKEIKKGIESCDNFVFIMSPYSINSPYCVDEVEYAASLNKRFITILLKPIETKSLHYTLAKVQWLDFQQGNFFLHFNELVRVLDTDRDYVRSHNKWLQRALEWQKNQKSGDLLLRGTELKMAQLWLKEIENKKGDPPPTELQKEYISTSKNYRRNLRLRLISIGSGIGLLLATWQFNVIRSHLLENETRVIELIDNKYNIDDVNIGGLFLAIATTAQSQEKLLGYVLPEVKNGLLKALKSVREKTIFKGKGPVYSVVLSHDSNHIISGSGNTLNRDSIVTVWDLKGNRVPKTLKQNKKEMVTSLALTNDDKYIFSGNWDGTITKWDLQQAHPVPKILTEPKKDKDMVTSVSLSHTGKYLVSGTKNGLIKVWDLQKQNQPQLTLDNGDHVNSVVFSHDDKSLLSSTQVGNIKLWDLKQAKPLYQLDAQVFSMALSDNGRYIVSGHGDGIIKIWDLQKQQTVIRLTMDTNADEDLKEVTSVAFSHNGKYIVSGSRSGTIIVWDLKQGQPLGKPLTGHTRVVRSLLFSPNDDYIVSGSDDKTIRVWDLPLSAQETSNLENLNLNDLLKKGCEQLKAQPSFRHPHGEIQKETKEACEKYAK